MNTKILFGIIVLCLVVLTGCSNKLHTTNEAILEKVLLLENISVNKVNMQSDEIFVSIEASGAGEYDTQIINWWGTIFGIAGMLQGEYQVVVIENTVNGVPYTYISANIFSVRDYTNDLITDVEFWSEALITTNRPSVTEIIKASGLPVETLSATKKTKTSLRMNDVLVKVSAGIIILAICIAGIMFVSRVTKKKKHNINIKKHVKQVKAKTLEAKQQMHKAYHKKIKPAAQKTFAKAKQTYQQTIKPKSKEFYTKTKSKATKLVHQAKEMIAKKSSVKSKKKKSKDNPTSKKK